MRWHLNEVEIVVADDERMTSSSTVETVGSVDAPPP